MTKKSLTRRLMEKKAGKINVKVNTSDVGLFIRENRNEDNSNEWEKEQEEKQKALTKKLEKRKLEQNKEQAKIEAALHINNLSLRKDRAARREALRKAGVKNL